MAIYYVDLENGNDTTGDGSANAPFLTQGRASSEMVSNDELRLAKNTTADTTISANFTWTASSTTVTVDSDVTSDLSIGDYLGKTVASGNGNFETFYRISAISYSAPTTTITLDHRYYGTTETISSSTKKFIQTDGGNDQASNSTLNWYLGGSGGNTVRENCTVSGGWNLATETRDGETWFTNSFDRSSDWFVYEGTSGTPAHTYEYLNIVDVDEIFGSQNTSNTIIRNCTLHPYRGFAGFTNATWENVNNCALFSYAGRIWLDQTDNSHTVNNVYFNTKNNEAFYIQRGSIGSGVHTFNDCVFLGLTGLDFNEINISVELNNTLFMGGTNGIVSDQNGSIVKFNETSKIENYTNGIEVGTQVYGVRLKSPVTNNCTHGIHATRTFGLIVENHTADGCDRCIDFGDMYSKNMFLYGFNYTNVGEFALYSLARNTTNQISGGTIDDTAKLIYNPSPSYQNPEYTAQGIAGINDGIYWPTKRWQKYNDVFRTSAPSFWYSTDIDDFNSHYPNKVFSMYGLSGERYKISFYIRMGGPSWNGKIETDIRLDGKPIQDFTTIETAYSDWQLVELELTNPITSDGELSVNMVVNQNINDLYLDDFSYVTL